MKLHILIVSTVLAVGISLNALAEETIKTGIAWNEEKAREVALKNIERQVDVAYFKSEDIHYQEHVKLHLNDPNLKFANRQVTYFTGGDYAVVYKKLYAAILR